VKNTAKALGLLAVMTWLALTLPLEIAPAVAAPGATFDADGVWGISEQGTDKQGASCDRWATGPGSSPTAISDTDPGIQSPPTNDENHVRYGAEDTDAAACHPFANQSGFAFDDLRNLLEKEEFDSFCSPDDRASPPRSFEEFISQESCYTPDKAGGIRVNIAPFQRAGFLSSPVLSEKDLEKAIVDRAKYRADERRLCRLGKLRCPSWWKP
jgi:hypothetical protein